MDNDRELLQKLIDGDATPEEKSLLAARMQTDPALEKEFDGLSNVMRLVEESPRMPAPPGFTAGVMKRLPSRRPSLTERLVEFVLKERVLKWNMAAALGMAALAVIAYGLVINLKTPLGLDAFLRQSEPIVNVRIHFYAPEAGRVSIAGDFNKWKTDSHVMSREDGGLWTIEMPMKPGVYNYMLVVDDKTWVADPDAETYRDDGFGNMNSVMRVSI